MFALGGRGAGERRGISEGEQVVELHELTSCDLAPEPAWDGGEAAGWTQLSLASVVVVTFVVLVAVAAAASVARGRGARSRGGGRGGSGAAALTAGRGRGGGGTPVVLAPRGPMHLPPGGGGESLHDLRWRSPLSRCLRVAA